MSPERTPRYQVVIGWNEYVDLPEWGITGLRAKVDTGARSSALHVEDLEELGHGRVRFDVVLDRQRGRRKRVEAHIRRRGRVRSSTGRYTNRIFVVTNLKMGPIRRAVELSLVDRERMNFRMLLGRSALAGNFLVDVSHAKLLGRSKAKARKRTKRS